MKLTKLLASLSIIGALGFMTNVHAAGTLAGTTINNTANLAFSIAGVAQTPKPSNTVSFLVDNKINVIIEEAQNGVPSEGTAGKKNVPIRFKVTNLGNYNQSYTFITTQLASGTSLYGKTDNMDLTCRVIEDTNNNGVYEATTIDNGSNLDNMTPDSSRYVFLVCDIGTARQNDDFGVVSITARTRSVGTFGGQNQTTGANTAGVDIVFADGAGTDDAVRDGNFSARGAILVKTASLSVAKTSTPICDPFNFNVDPKNIPGAFVRYSIAITNAANAGSSANLAVISDTLDILNLTFDPNLIAPTASSCSASTPPESLAGNAFKISCSGTSNTRACTTIPIYKTGVGGDDGSQFVSPNVSGDLSLALPAEAGYEAGELKVGETVTFEFNAMVK